MANAKKMLMHLMVILLAGLFAVTCGCGDDDDDSGGDDDANDDDIDDDTDDDDDDDADDDVNDDVNDDADDDIDDDVDDDIDDDVDDDIDDDTEEFEVDASSDAWQETDTTITAGEVVTLQADGQITIRVGVDVGPEGGDQFCGQGCPMPEAPEGMLLFRIGDSKGLANTWRIDPFIAVDSGVLQFLVNDSDYTDNTGSFFTELNAQPVSEQIGIFVTTGGNNGNPGTMDEPMGSIDAGIEKAREQGKHVFVASGNYIGTVETDVSLYGGYRGLDWVRDIEGEPTKITGLVCDEYSRSRGVRVLKRDDGLGVSVDGFVISGGEGGCDSSYGVYIDYGASALLANNEIDGGVSVIESFGVFGGEWTSVCYATLTNNVVDGGQSRHTVGVRLYAHASLEFNDISGGHSIAGSTGLTLYEHASVVSGRFNDISGGTTDCAEYTPDTGYGCYISGIAQAYGHLSMTNSTIDAGTVTGVAPVATGPQMNGVLLAGINTYMENNTITTGNYLSPGEGTPFVGAGWLLDGEMLLRHNEFIGLQAPGLDADAHGLIVNGYVADLQGTIDGNVIKTGTTAGDTVGVSVVDANLLFANNFIICEPGGNNSTGVVVNGRYETILSNNTIYAGSPAESSVGIYFGNSNFFEAMNFYVVNNIIDAGSGGLDTRAISISPGIHLLTLWNNDLFGGGNLCPVWDRVTELCVGDIDDVNGCAWNGCNEAGANISDAPGYVGGGDFHIGTGPCSNSGIDPTLFGAGDTADHDIDGDPRPYGGGWDIGGDEQSS